MGVGLTSTCQVGRLVGWSVSRSVSQLVVNRQVGRLVSHQVSWLVGRSVSWSSIIKFVGWLVSHEVSWLVGRLVGQLVVNRQVGRLVVYSVQSVGRMSSRKCLLAILGEGWGPHSMPRPAHMRKALRLFNFFIT